MKDRIKQIMDSQRMTQQEFANHLSLSPASLSSIFNGRTNPTLNIVEAIKKKFPNISTDWLMFGVGSMNGDKAEADPPVQKVTSTTGEQVIDFGDNPQPSSTLSDGGNTPKRANQVNIDVMKNVYKQQRNITEIRIFYDDQTWETFVPKK